MELLRRISGGGSVLTALWLLLFAATAAAAPSGESPRTARLRLAGEEIEVDPASSTALLKLMDWIDRNIESPGLSKKDRRGLNAMRERAEMLVAGPAAAERIGPELLELALAISNNRRSPVPRSLDFFEVPWMLLDHCYNPIGRGGFAADLASSQTEPEPSSFWKAGAPIEGRDLYHGYGRTNIPEYGSMVWRYRGPKTGFGRNPGIELENGGLRIQAKFAEIHSEPFAARLFSALGYNTDWTDYAPGLEVLYDRALFLEFNSREPIQTRFQLFGFVPVHTMQLQPHHDPFQFIAEARLKDGACLDAAEFRRRLLIDPRAKRLAPEHFRADFEAQVHSILTVAANVQIDRKGIQSVGPWDFGQLDHANRRELRGAGLLAAWIGWCDSRFENTRLRLVKNGPDADLAHYFSDLGGGLGEAQGLFSWKEQLPNAFPWTFTRSGYTSNRLGSRHWFRIVNFKLLEDTPAFARMTVDDARWMARRICRLGEPQIVQALAGAGFDSAAIRLYTEKLIARRDRMVIDLGLDDEICLLRPRGAARRLEYNPADSGPIHARLPCGRVAVARVGDTWVKRGRLETRLGSVLDTPDPTQSAD